MSTLEVEIEAFCYRHDVHPADGIARLWGFGTVPIIFASRDGKRVWTWLKDLADPAGLPEDALYCAYFNHLAEGREHADSVVIACEDGVRELRLVDGEFIRAVFRDLSPWSGVLRANIAAGEPGVGPAGALRSLAPPDF